MTLRRPAIRIVLAPLQQHRSKLQRLKGERICGMQQGRTIYLDPRTENPISTFVHEKFHMAHPEWSEDEVLAAEHQWWTKAGWREKAEVLLLIGRAEIKNPKEVIG